ncbi:MAG TPA: YajQ family cyclic di-GMP-binding protein [Polyangiaceae bacterium]|nr:YajQ family cyclic di-GMP-binding protein [Polyangiaceae bacterium]
MPSFDIVSKVQWHEVENAVNQAEKEVGQRFDFKDTGTEVEKTGNDIVVRSSSEERAKAALAVVQEKLIKRKVSSKSFETGKPEPTSKGGSKITLKVKEGIETDKARVIVQSVKDAKLKVQAAIQGDQLRVTGKSKDELQTAIQHLKAQDFGLELQYINFRD